MSDNKHPRFMYLVQCTFLNPAGEKKTAGGYIGGDSILEARAAKRAQLKSYHGEITELDFTEVSKAGDYGDILSKILADNTKGE